MKKILLIVYTALSFGYLAALPSDLDLTFNGTGYATLSVAADTYGQGVIEQPDGKVVATGFSYIEGNPRLIVARYNSDGTPDTGFGSAGVKIFNEFGTTSNGFSVALQADGKIVVVGFLDNNLLVVRFTTSGQLDTSFNTAGYVALMVGEASSTAYSVSIQDDQKIVVAGTAQIAGGEAPYVGQMVVCRFNPNGLFDSSFNFSGVLLIPTEGALNMSGVSTAIQADGKILVAGAWFQDNTPQSILVRINGVDGTLDGSFGLGGSVIFPFPSVGLSVALQSTEKIILYAITIGGPLIVRLLVNGDIDTSFGTDGYILVPGDYVYQDRLVRVQGDDKIVFVGTRNSRICVARYMAEGQPDTTFSADGTVDLPIGDNSYGRAISLQQDGKILATGYGTFAESGYKLILARLLGDEITPVSEPKFSIAAWLKTVYAEELGYAPDQMGFISAA